MRVAKSSCDSYTHRAGGGTRGKVSISACTGIERSTSRRVGVSGMSSPSGRLGAAPHRGGDLDVRAAAAQVAAEGLGDLGVARVRVLLQQPLRRQDEARRAPAALV